MRPAPVSDWITPTSRLLSLPASTGTAGSAFPISLPETFMGREVPDPVYYTDIADMMVAHCAESEQQLHELYRRILFNILVSNNDDHLQKPRISLCRLQPLALVACL